MDAASTIHPYLNRASRIAQTVPFPTDGTVPTVGGTAALTVTQTEASGTREQLLCMQVHAAPLAESTSTEFMLKRSKPALSASPHGPQRGRFRLLHPDLITPLFHKTLSPSPDLFFFETFCLDKLNLKQTFTEFHL